MTIQHLSIRTSKGFFFAIAFCLLGVLAADLRAEAAASSDHLPTANLSLEALEALTVNIAIYDDTTVEQILQAAQQPAALHDAAAGAIARDEWSPGLRALLAYPALIQQLDNDLAHTARLGVASQNQLDDVWVAVDSVRAKLQAAGINSQDAGNESSVNESNGEVTFIDTAYVTGNPVGYPVAYYPYVEAVARGYWTAAVWHELNQNTTANATTTNSTYVGTNGQTATTTTQTVTAQYHNGTTDAVVGAGATTVEGPNGNSAYAQGVAGAGVTTVGDTTYVGAAGAGSINGSGGNTVQGAGQATGSVTQTSQGSSFQSQSSGKFNSNFGSAGTASHHQQGSTTHNSDGSTSFQHASGGNLQATNAQGIYSHQGSGTYVGDGTGSYQGSSTIDTGQGSAQTSTTAGNGQASTTVSTGNGTSTYTAGDQQLGSTSRQAANQSAGRLASQAFANRFDQSSKTSRPTNNVLGDANLEALTSSHGIFSDTARTTESSLANRVGDSSSFQNSLRATGNSYSNKQSSWNQTRGSLVSGNVGQANGLTSGSPSSLGVRGSAPSRSGSSRGISPRGSVSRGGRGR